MCRLLETIKIAGGVIHHLAYHNRRANDARRALFGAPDEIDVGEGIDPAAGGLAAPVVKCRVLFRERVEKVEYHPYRLPAIGSLKVVRADGIDYRFKYEDRSDLEGLRARRGACDEILIVRRGLITDTSFSNVVFGDGTRLFTPARPLLEGVRRAALIDAGAITPEEIALRDLERFKKVFLINSLIGLEDDVSVEIGRIVD